MIPIGICTDFENLPEAHEIGFDFVEIPLADLTTLPESHFLEFVDYIESADICVKASYRMLPDGMHITGPDVSAQALHTYLSTAFSRARRLGIEIVGMDAAKARAVPESFDFPMAWRQLGNFLRLAQGHASNAGVRIAVEPIRKSECNVLNLVSEATLMTALLQLNNVGVLANLGHMGMASEPLGTLRHAMPLLWHIHIQGTLKNAMPHLGDGETYEKPFRLLSEWGYSGGISISAPATKDFHREATAALERLRAAQTN